MRWVPQRFNDTLAIVTVVLFIGFLGWVVSRGDLNDAIMLIVGQLLAMLVLIYQFYFRKKPE